MSRRLYIAILVGVGLLSTVAVAASAASAPTAITGPVSTVGTTTATVTGTVNPNGQATNRYFEYGTNTTYGSNSASVGVGSGAANVGVSAPLAGLTPGTTYHYRVVATNGTGTSRGADGVFATHAPPGASTGAATSVTPRSATLHGTVDPNSRATTWFFEYGTSTSYGSQTPTTSAGSGTSSRSVSAAVSGLATGVVFHFRLVATSDAGTTRGADRTFSTLGAPTVVTGAATSIAPTSARINGRVTPNGQTTTWLFEYGTTSRYGSRTSAGNAGSGTTAVAISRSLTRLKAGTTYHYRVTATNPSGTSVGSDRTFTTTGPPRVVTGAVVGVGPTSATAGGSVDPLGRATTWYVEFGTSTTYGSKTPTTSAGSRAGPHSVSAPLSGLTPATTYHYRLVAKSDAGTSYGGDIAFTTTGVTLTLPVQRVVFGRSLSLTGTVPTLRPGELVIVSSQAFGEASFSPIATVQSTANGAWRYLAKPRIGTSYRASWNGGVSAAAAVGVRPAVSFRRVGGRKFATHAYGERSFAHHVVQLQRLTADRRWVTVKRVRLGRHSGAVFRASLPAGRSVLRIAMSVNQAGPGYLAGFSRAIVYRR